MAKEIDEEYERRCEPVKMDASVDASSGALVLTIRSALPDEETIENFRREWKMIVRARKEGPSCA